MKMSANLHKSKQTLYTSRSNYIKRKFPNDSRIRDLNKDQQATEHRKNTYKAHLSLNSTGSKNHGITCQTKC